MKSFKQLLIYIPIFILWIVTSSSSYSSTQSGAYSQIVLRMSRTCQMCIVFTTCGWWMGEYKIVLIKSSFTFSTLHHVTHCSGMRESYNDSLTLSLLFFALFHCFHFAKEKRSPVRGICQQIKCTSHLIHELNL